MKKDLQRPMQLILQRCRSQWRLQWQRFEAVLLRHSRCCQDAGLSQKQPCCRNGVGSREWHPLPKFRQGLRSCESGVGWCGLQGDRDLRSQSLGCQDWMGLRVTLLWHSRCFREQDSLLWSLGCQNLMGLREWRPLPNFRHSLRRHKLGGGGWGLRKGEDSLWWSLGCQNWMGLRFQRPCPNFGHSLRRRQSSDAPRQGRLDHTKGQTWKQGHNSTLNGKFLPLARLIRPRT